MDVAPTRRAAADTPLDRWDDPARGRIAWRTLLSAGLTPSDKLVCGVAELAPGDWLAPHRHAEAELYFGLDGRVRVTIDDVPHDLAPGVALFIPGGAIHAAAAQDGPARYLYVFAADRFEDIVYDFGTGGGDGA